MDSENIDKLIPQIAKNKAEIERLRQIVASRETRHQILIGDARDL
jgi:hypothetical protein